MTISLCMIVKNEEAVLARCLDSVREAVDEIVIVDTGSTDRTREIAARYTDRIFDFPWIDDFAAARNEAFRHGKSEYLMWLDADDVIPPQELEKLLALKKTLPPEIATVMLPYHVAFDAAGRPTMTCYRERLLRRDRHPLWQGAIHEAVEPMAPVYYGEAAVHHRKQGQPDPGRNLRIFEGMLERGQALSPREQYYYGRELMAHGRYGQAAAVLEVFLAEGQGWSVNCIGACMDLARCREQLGEEEEALSALLSALRYGPPSAEVCCALGGWFVDAKRWSDAVFWYELALTRQEDGRSGGFVQPEAGGYIPLMQLCVCHDRLGQYALAAEYNERAAQLKPDDPAVAFNREYFLNR